MASESLLNHLQEWETESPTPSLSAEAGRDLMRNMSSEPAGEDLHQHCQSEQSGLDGRNCGVQDDGARVEVARSRSLEADCLRR